MNLKSLALMFLLLTTLGTVIPVMAKAQKTAFRQGDDETIEESEGFVIFNSPKGKVTLIIRVKVKGLDNETVYYAYIHGLQPDYTGPMTDIGGGWNQLAEFETDADGNAVIHVNILDSELPAGTYDLRVSIDETGYVTVLTFDAISVIVN